MLNNPELQRNLWLEFTRHRIVIIPVVLFLVHFVAFIGNGYRLGEPVLTTALWMYFLISVVWGARLAGESVVSEINNKTWDAQRMSSLSPWSMTWGKLFGGTIISWYGATFCLIVIIINHVNIVNMRDSFSFYSMWRTNSLSTGQLVLFCILTGVLAQSISFIASLISIHKGAPQHRSLSNLYVLLAAITTLMLVTYAFKSPGLATWYDWVFRSHYFLLVSLSIFIVWSLVAAYRLMRLELQVKNTPLVWLAFVIFLAVYLAGFVQQSDQFYTFKRWLIAYSVVVFLTYVMAFADNKNPMILRRLFVNIRKRNWRQVAESIPAWFVSICMVFLILIMLVMQNNSVFRLFDATINYRYYSIAVFVFAIRDVSLIIYFNISNKRGRADLTAMLYLLVLYYLLPLLFSVAKSSIGFALFVPLNTEYPVITVISAIVQAIIIILLSMRRWRHFFTH